MPVTENIIVITQIITNTLKEHKVFGNENYMTKINFYYSAISVILHKILQTIKM